MSSETVGWMWTARSMIVYGAIGIHHVDDAVDAHFHHGPLAKVR